MNSNAPATETKSERNFIIGFLRDGPSPVTFGFTNRVRDGKTFLAIFGRFGRGGSPEPPSGD